MIPRQLFLTKGTGVHKEKLISLELALRDAGIAQFNLVKVTSIFPPGCTITTKEKGLEHLSPGEIVFCVLSENSTNEPKRLIAASIGLAMPEDKSKYGYLLEHQSFDEKTEGAGDYAELLATEMMATTFAEESGGNADWDEHKDRRDGIAETMNVTQIATSAGNGLWTTVVAVAVFIPEGD
ncbi:MAG: arginine decarboxylase, pyruvoyl-dependent [Candidatus Aminicenantes bacterium]|nr:arginine decarboxylase, pyruvoyl-dependent [Candidatus Aminicenantes bacterium]